MTRNTNRAPGYACTEDARSSSGKLSSYSKFLPALALFFYVKNNVSIFWCCHTANTFQNAGEVGAVARPVDG